MESVILSQVERIIKEQNEKGVKLSKYFHLIHEFNRFILLITGLKNLIEVLKQLNNKSIRH